MLRINLTKYVFFYFRFILLHVNNAKAYRVISEFDNVLPLREGGTYM